MLTKFLKGLVFFGLVFGLSFVLWDRVVPRSDALLTKQDFLRSEPRPLTYVAIGDSLTQGVGDTTDQGGFVPILAQHLSQEYGYEVASYNYGVSGNTSQQILKRMREQEEIQKQLAKADLLTLTVGGNDLLKVLRKHITNLKLSTFSKASLAYQDRLRQVINLARQDNPNLPIYILGIYNPFYLNFPELTDLQTVVDNWNKATKAITEEYDRVYFVPINDLLYKGVDGKEVLVENSDSSSPVVNDALFLEDRFHPNIVGYQLMTTAILEVMDDSKKDWD